MTAIVQILFSLSLNHYGTAFSISEFTTIFTITNLALMSAVRINQGSVPIIGYNYGQTKYQRVKQTFIQGTLVATIIFFIGYLLIYLMPILLFNGLTLMTYY